MFKLNYIGGLLPFTYIYFFKIYVQEVKYSMDQLILKNYNMFSNILTIGNSLHEQNTNTPHTFLYGITILKLLV